MLLLGAFGGVFVSRQNYEFVIYILVIITYILLVVISIKKIKYTTAALVGLTVWSALHLAGGGFSVGNGRLYDVILLPLSADYPVFRYDQLVHILGFGAATLVAFSLLRDLLNSNATRSIAFRIVLVMTGLGMGALNEILEFGVNIIVPESGVGGYVNTSLDLCSDLVGSIFGVGYIHWRYLK